MRYYIIVSFLLLTVIVILGIFNPKKPGVDFKLPYLYGRTGKINIENFGPDKSSLTDVNSGSSSLYGWNYNEDDDDDDDNIKLNIHKHNKKKDVKSK